jgi:type IV secretory pathway VirB4 component
MSQKRLVGTPWDAALTQPFVGSALPRMPGVPLGVYTQLKSPFIFDPYWAHRLEIVNSQVFLITGNKNAGKSTLMKTIALRLGGRRGRDLGDGRTQQMRLRINDRKIEDRDPEFLQVVEHLEGEVLQLNRHASINVFDPKMEMGQLDVVEAAVNICEMVSGISPLPRFQNLALRVGVWKMLKEREREASPEALEAKLLGLGMDDVVDYYHETNPDATRINITDALFQEDAMICAMNMGELLHGSFGGIFGGHRSLRDALSSHVLLLDWTGVPEKARTLLAAMLWKWQEIAQRRGDHELIPDLFFSDEEHQALRNLMYVRFMSASLKEARALRTAFFMSTQHETDLTMAGDPGTEIRRLSESIGLSIGGRFIAQQPEKQEILDLYRDLGFSEPDAKSLPALRKGYFFFHAPNYPPVPFRLDLTATEKELVKTDSAVRSMTTGLNDDPINQGAVLLGS